MITNPTRQLILNNIQLLEYCKHTGLNTKKLNECRLERMDNEYYICLSVGGVDKSKSDIPLDVDIDTQPKIVLIIEVDGDDIKIKSTEHTKLLKG